MLDAYNRYVGPKHTGIDFASLARKNEDLVPLTLSDGTVILILFVCHRMPQWLSLGDLEQVSARSRNMSDANTTTMQSFSIHLEL